MTRLKLLAVIFGLQVLFFAGWAVREEMRFLPGAGQSIMVRVVPVDPRDLLSGQYINLTYDFTRFRVNDDKPVDNADIWVVLHEKDGFFVVRAGSAERPTSVLAGDVVMKGRVGRWGRNEFGVERCYVHEGTLTPNQNKITVRLRIGSDYSPRIECVYVDGKPWP